MTEDASSGSRMYSAAVQSRGVCRVSDGRDNRGERPSTNAGGPGGRTRRYVFSQVCSIKKLYRDSEGEVVQRRVKDRRQGAVAVASNMCNDHRLVPILQREGGESNQVAIPADKFLDAFKRPLEGRKPAEFDPEVVLAFNAEKTHIQTPSMESDREASGEEQPSVAGSGEPFLATELDQVAAGTQ